ncbi:unnamed protein product, partial [Ectocarpus sp. 12 AP-2014]
VLLLVLYALFWSTPTVLLVEELPEYVLELRVFAELLEVVALEVVLLYLGELPLVFTLERPLAAVEDNPLLFVVFLL